MCKSQSFSEVAASRGQHGGDCLKTCSMIHSSPSPPRSGGEGRGEEALFSFQFLRIPSSILSPFVPHGERKMRVRVFGQPGRLSCLRNLCRDSNCNSRSKSLWGR